MIWGVVAMVFLGAVIVTRVLGLKRISAQWAIEEGDTARARALTLAGRLVVAGSVIAVLGGLLNVGAIVGVGFALIALSITPPLYYVGVIMDCNQGRIPLVFLHDVNGFMVGRDAEWSGIIRAGTKMVNAVANSVVPKITVIVGGSFAGADTMRCAARRTTRALCLRGPRRATR